MARVFDLAQVYGAIDDAEESKLRREHQTMQNQRMQMDNAEQVLIRDSAKNAIDPQTGEYSPEIHAQQLEQGGRGDLAHKLRLSLRDDAQKVVEWVSKMTPYVNERTYPKVREIAAQSGIELPETYNKEEFDQLAQNILTRSRELASYGEPEQVPGARAGTVGQKNLATGKYDILDYMGKGGRGGAGGGGDGTGIERITQRIMEELGIKYTPAYLIAKGWDPSKSGDEFYRDVALKVLGQYDTTGRAAEKAAALTRSLYPGWQPGTGRGNAPPPAPARRPQYDPAGILGGPRNPPPPP